MANLLKRQNIEPPWLFAPAVMLLISVLMFNTARVIEADRAELCEIPGKDS